jgi:hypothetical protein
VAALGRMMLKDKNKEISGKEKLKQKKKIYQMSPHNPKEYIILLYW